MNNGVFFDAGRMLRSSVQGETSPAVPVLPLSASFPVLITCAPTIPGNLDVPVATRSSIQKATLVSSANEIVESHTAATAPIFAPDFRFPIGISTELCWNRWHDALNPLRNITPKLFSSSTTLSPAEAARELGKRRKIKGVMEILQGQTTDRTVDLDPSYVWKACWDRCVTLFGIEKQRGSAWTASTLYDKLTMQPERMIEARAAPSIQLLK